MYPFLYKVNSRNNCSVGLCHCTPFPPPPHPGSQLEIILSFWLVRLAQLLHHSRTRAVLLIGGSLKLMAESWRLHCCPGLWATSFSASCADISVSSGKEKDSPVPWRVSAVCWLFEDNISGHGANDVGNGFCGWLNAGVMWQLPSVAVSPSHLTTERYLAKSPDSEGGGQWAVTPRIFRTILWLRQ